MNAENIKSCKKCVKKKECKIYDKCNGEMLPATLARTCNEYQEVMPKEEKEFNNRIKTLRLDKKEKEELYAKFIIRLENGFKCAYCFEKMNLKYGTEKSFTIDHTLSRKHGGQDEINNLEFICSTCNSMKGEMDANRFILNLDRLKARKRKRETYKARKSSKGDREREAFKQMFKMRAER